VNRITVHFSGRVQGVGFRYTVCQVAEEFAVCGSVRNLADGRVELVAEGRDDELARFVEAIEVAMRGHIRERTLNRGPASGEFTDFRVAY